MFWVLKRIVSLRRVRFENPQHMFLLRNKKMNFWYALLTKVLYLLYIGRMGVCDVLIGAYYDILFYDIVIVYMLYYICCSGKQTFRYASKIFIL